MKTKSLENMVVFEPESTHDAFLLGQLFVRTGKLFGISTAKPKDVTIEFLGLRCEPRVLVNAFLKAMQDQIPF